VGRRLGKPLVEVKGKSKIILFWAQRPEWVRVWVWRSKISSLSISNSLFFLGVKEQNILKLKYARGAQAQTHSFFVCGLRTNALLWPFFHMLHRRTITNSHAHVHQRKIYFWCKNFFVSHLLTGSS